MKRAMQGIVLTALSVMLSSGVYAAESSVKKSALPVVPAHAAAEKPAEKVAASTAVALYESPELTSKVLGHFPVTANLVGIIRQGDWVKVGNRENGQTGWVNLKAYHAAQQAFYHDYFHMSTETIYVRQGKGQDAKPVVEVYRNGKKLSDSDAQQYYDQMKKQQEQQWQTMQHFNQIVNQQMDGMMASPLMFMPGVVIVEQPPVTKTDEKPVENTEKKAAVHDKTESKQ